MPLRLLSWLLWIALAGGSEAQESPAAAPPAAVPTVEAIKAAAAAAAARSDLSPGEKTKVQESYDAALALLEAAAASEAKGKAFRESIESAPDATRIAEAEAGMIRIPAEAGEALSAEERALEIGERKALLSREEAAVVQAESRLKELETAITAESERPQKITEELTQAQERERLASEALAVLPGDGGAVEVAERTRLEAQVHASRSRLAALEHERASAPFRASLFKAHRDLQTRKAALGRVRVEALQALVKAAVEDVAKAAEEAAGDPQKTAAGSLAREVAAYSADLRTITERVATVRKQKSEQSERLAKLEADFALIVRQLEATGGEGAAAHLLLDQQRRLPDLRRLRRDRKFQAEDPAEVRLTRVSIDAELARLRREPDVDDADTRKLGESKRELLEQLSEQHGQLIRELGELDLAHEAFLAKLEEFEQLLDEKLFWVRSSPPLGMETVTQFPAAVTWAAGPSRAARLGWALREAWSRAPIRLWGMVLVVAVLFLLRPRMRRQVAGYLPKIRRVSSDRYTYTLEALGLVLLISVPFSLLMWVVGRQLLFVPGTQDWVLGVGHGLMEAALTLLGFMVVREICRKDGLAEVHFRWRRPVASKLKRAATGLAWVYVPATLVIVLLFTESSGRHVHSLGRIVFMAAMLWVACWVVILLRPKRGLLAEVIEKHPEGLLSRLRYLWLAGLVLVPLDLAALAGLGYFVAALLLSGYLQISAAIGVGSVIAYHLMLRFFTVRERKLALERTLAARKAKREAAAQAATEEAASASAGSEEAPLPDAEQEALDLAQVGVQTRRMLRALVISGALAGLWFVWADALPALRTLDTDPVLGSATRADLILAALVAIATTIVAKNLPGILEIAVLQRLPLAGGSRYAVASLAQYVIVAIGLFVMFQILPIDWSKFGWIVAALSVGLGFGLQEIVANFVCGIILLFERPIRVGDVVTVSNVTGTVTRMRLRATTITDWDRKEFVVPNKEFITGQVLNWTLSNTTNRLVLNVGVAYGSDTDRVRSVLLEILDEHPDVLAEPAPLVTFERLGDSSLDFVVRAYLPALDRRLRVTHELYTAIHRRFGEEGIEIPFPQRDLHMRSGWGGGGGEN